jgi:hypothetical protein
MSEEQSKDSKPMTDRERGRAFLDGFKKLPYNRDRIGQSFVMKQKSTSRNQTENQELLRKNFTRS